MSFVGDKQVVEALSSRRLHPSLRNRVCPGRPERRSHLLDAEPPQAAIESRAIATVTIVDQKPRWLSIPSAALYYLLGYPFCRRKWRYRNVQDFPVRVPDYKKDIESLKQNCLDAEEIARPYARFMALQEFPPTRGWPSTVSRIHILCDSPRRNRKPQSREFGLDPLLTPKPIFCGHPSDERLKFLGNRMTTAPPPLPT